MPAGRPKKPNALHIMEGTARPVRGTDKVFKTPEPFQTKPKPINYTKFKKKKFFKGLARWVESLTGQCSVDSIPLSVISDTMDIYIQAQIDIDENGVFKNQFDKFGNIIGKTESPAFRIRQQASNELMRLVREYGITPLSRDKFAKAEDEENNPMAELLRIAQEK